jgi:cbb3-type cytochrome oxidase subunit 1
MLAGVFIAAQLAWPALNLDIPWLSYGRLRPLHTNVAVVLEGPAREWRLTRSWSWAKQPELHVEADPGMK